MEWVRRGCTLEARLLVREEAVEAEDAQDEAPADAEKDKALIDAFSAAIAVALAV